MTYRKVRKCINNKKEKEDIKIIAQSNPKIQKKNKERQ